MLKKFGNATKQISPILDLMKQETNGVFSAIQSGDFTQLGNTVERLGLLTSRLYSEYLVCQSQLSENPSLLNEALQVLTRSQEATIEAQNVMNQQRQGGQFGSTEGTPEEPLLVRIEKRATLISAVAIPAWLFWVSRDMGMIKGSITKGLALTSGLVSLRYYMKQGASK